MLLAQAALAVVRPQTGIALFSLLPILIGLATWIIILIAIWRAMKAHESIAESLRQIARKDKIQ